jgi:hypothetical protein
VAVASPGEDGPSAFTPFARPDDGGLEALQAKQATHTDVERKELLIVP